MSLLIFWDADAPEGFQAPLTRALSGLLPCRISLCDSPVILNGYIGSRRQTDAAALLDSLDLHKRRNHVRAPVLLVVSQDLCRDGDEFLFGLARPSTATAVVSTARLENAFYDLPDDNEMLTDRLIKESAHEVGHLLGLPHCPDEECIMHNPLTLQDLNRKRQWFCDRCREVLSQGAED